MELSKKIEDAKESAADIMDTIQRRWGSEVLKIGVHFANAQTFSFLLKEMFDGNVKYDERLGSHLAEMVKDELILLTGVSMRSHIETRGELEEWFNLVRAMNERMLVVKG